MGYAEQEEAHYRSQKHAEIALPILQIIRELKSEKQPLFCMKNYNYHLIYEEFNIVIEVRLRPKKFKRNNWENLRE